MFEHTMCSSNLQGTQDSETARYMRQPCHPFYRGTYIRKRPFIGDFIRVKRLLEKVGKTGPIQFQAPLGL